MANDTSSHNCQELLSIPIVRHFWGLFNRVKEKNWLLRTYCDGLEKCGSFVLRRVYPFTKLATAVESKIAKIKQDYPVVKLPPQKIWKKTKHFVSFTVRRVAKPVFSSAFGKYVFHSLRWSLFAVEKLYSFMKWSDNPHSAYQESNEANGETDVVHSTPIKPRSKRDQSVTTSSGESTTNSAMLNSKLTSSRSKQTSTMKKESEVDKMSIVQRIPLVSRLYGILVLTPLELFINGLRAIRRFISILSYGRRRRIPSGKSPVKIYKLRTRRKVSPRKRIHTTLIGRIANSTCRILGLKPPSPLRQKDIRSYFKASSKDQELNKSPNREDSENKRKHDEILSDYDSDEMNMLTMNFESYRSDDDPDYEPFYHDTSDETIEPEDDFDEESDLEIENLPGGQLQIKANDGAETMPLMSTSGRKLTKAVSFDNWEEINEDGNTSKSQSEPRTPLGEIISHSNVIVNTDKPKTSEAPPSVTNQKNVDTDGSSCRTVDASILSEHGHGIYCKKDKTATKKV